MGRMRWPGWRRGLLLGVPAALLVCWGTAGCGAGHPLALAIPEGLRTVEHFESPLGDSFVSVWRPRGSHKSVLEQFSLRNGTPLRTLLDLPERRAGGDSVALGSGGVAWLTISRGPRLRSWDSPGADPAPDSCSGELIRFDPANEKLTTVRSFPESMFVLDAQPSPNGQTLAMLAGGCATSFFNRHLLAINVANGTQWTIGSKATPCHALSRPGWSKEG